MTDNQENRKNMFYATQKFLAANASIHIALPAFVAAAAGLDALEHRRFGVQQRSN
ncbi:MAG: hypothetical protein IPH60_04750 [Flavobacteriales bacterium]|nr:hypothetical protein [Flavobacteriales bacterium]